MLSHLFIGPPGVGKTTLQRAYPGRFLDPEDSINWREAERKHSLYLHKARRGDSSVLLEHELDWPSVWIEEVLPRIYAALLLEKDIVMGLITPANAEMVMRFLSSIRERTTLLLPEQTQHFQQAWNQPERRPRVWDSQLMGWQNTVWVRLLLQGLAAELGLKVVQTPLIATRNTQRRRGTATREALTEDKRVFIEVFFGRWAELNAQEEIVAMHREIASDEGIVLVCDKSSRACGKNLHDCERQTILRKDLYGRDLKTWIAHDKIKPSSSKKKALLFFAGTLAPFHHGHEEALTAAKQHLEQQGWDVIGGFVSPFKNLAEDRVGSLSSVLGPAVHRSTMVQLGFLSSNWLMADFPLEHVLHVEALLQGQHPTQRIAQRLRQQGILSVNETVTTFWINGKDAHVKPEFFSVFAHYADADRVNPLRMLIVDNRPGEDVWSEEALSETIPELLPYVERCRYRTENHSSATAVRQALLSGDRAALQQTVGLPMVEAYLMGLMHQWSMNTN